MTTVPITSPDEVWKQDILGRRSDANYLQNYLYSRHKSNPSEDGFVLAINSEWGFGKTFMLERWKQDAEFQGHPAVYFDAWKNDFTPDPLLAFISELEDGLTAHFKRIPIGQQQKAKALRVLKKVLKPAATIIATTALKHITGHSLESIKSLLTDDSSDATKSRGDEASEAASEASKKIGEAIKNALEPHKTVKESIKQFKENLKLLIEHLSVVRDVQLPILIFVDELDRCRPDYAIELLEGIKHLFGVPRVTFVVATNIPQLSESIKAVYGMGFDGQRYLHRFFDLQYTLPRPDNSSFSRLVLERISTSLPESGLYCYGLEFETALHPQKMEQYTTIDHFTVALSAYADTFGLSLRDISQISIMLEACFLTLKTERVHIFFLVFLVTIYKLNPVVFKKIQATRTLHNLHGLSSLLERGHPVNIEITSFDDYGRRSGTRNVSMMEIASKYLEFLEISDFNNINSQGFPNTNFDPNEYGNRQSNKKYTAKFEKYFSIVEQAGGFILRTKK